MKKNNSDLTCKWFNHCAGEYITECESVIFYIKEDVPNDKYKHCPHCGGKIVEINCYPEDHKKEALFEQAKKLDDEKLKELSMQIREEIINRDPSLRLNSFFIECANNLDRFGYDKVEIRGFNEKQEITSVFEHDYKGEINNIFKV